MRSCSADAPRARRDRRAVLAGLLAVVLLLGPAVGYAAAQFGSRATVTFTITVRPAQPSPPTPSPSTPTEPPSTPTQPASTPTQSTPTPPGSTPPSGQ